MHSLSAWRRFVGDGKRLMVDTELTGFWVAEYLPSSFVIACIVSDVTCAMGSDVPRRHNSAVITVMRSSVRKPIDSYIGSPILLA
ncbi:hypothetical protein SAMN04487982_110240 [Streptomyces sp. ok210]|jgi:hypothetical protein|nr:hypothetical protein SAMN04487982_110240 [Streptomyces sp. ok210]